MKIRPSRRTFYISAGVLVLLVLLYFGFCSSPAVKVETGAVTRGEVLATVDAEGRTRYHDRYTVTAPVSGKMFRIELLEGNSIPRGFVVTRIDPTPTRPVDPTQVPEATVAPFAYAVYAPVDGTVTRIFEKSERVVAAGTPLIEISKPSRLEIVADVLSSDATQIRPNMDVIVENWGGDDRLPARVRYVEPQAVTKISALGVEEQRVDVVADFLEVPKSLGDNFRVDVRIVLWSGKDVLRVPSSALFRDGEGWAVFVARGSRAERREVVIGHRSPLFTEVISGLAEGEAVILHPPNTVEHGTRIDTD